MINRVTYCQGAAYLELHSVPYIIVTHSNLLVPRHQAQFVEPSSGLKGDTSSGATKPATLETGAEIQVPLFIKEGDVLRVDTRTGEYAERKSS